MAINREHLELAQEMGAAEQLLEERYYSCSMENMEEYQRIKCKVEGQRAWRIVQKILKHYRRLEGKK